MGLAGSIRKNSFFSFLSSSIRIVTNVLLFVGIARFYGPEVFGQFTAAHTLATLFLIFADFGIDLILTTEIARQRDKADKIFKKFFSLKVGVSCLAVVGMWIVPYVQEVSNSTRWLIDIFSFYVALTALTNFYFALFKGFEQLQYETKVSFFNNLVLLSALVALGIIGAPIHVVAIVFVGTRAIGLLTSIRIASKLVPNQSLGLDFRGWREGQNQLFVFGLQLLFGNLFFILDTLLLAFWKGDHEVGIYQSAFRLITLFLVIPEVMINAFMPVLSRFHEENRDRWDALGKLLNKTLFFIGLPISLIIFLYAEQIISIVYGTKAFAEAVPILRIFGIIVFVRFSVETYALMLTTSRRQKSRMLVVILATILNYSLNLYAIPNYGLSGAVWISLVTNLFVGAGYIVATRHLFINWIIDVRILVPLIVTVSIAMILWSIRTIPVWYIAPVIVTGYLLLFYFIGYTKDERQFVFSLQG